MRRRSIRRFSRNGGHPGVKRDLRDYTTNGLKKIVTGTRNRMQGKLFEDELEFTCDVMYRPNTAVITRAHPPVGGVPGKMYFTGKGAVDFIGSWNGVPICFDAKTKHDDPASFGYPDRDRFQAEFMRDFEHCGGVAFVILRAMTDGGQSLAYIIRDVDALARGESVKLRTTKKAGAPLKRLVPYLTPTPWRDNVVIKTWDFLQLLAQILDGEVPTNDGADQHQP